MRIINEISGLTDTLKAIKLKNKSIGLVPTMGALHAGHMELISRARQECDIVICSIYINPAQFNNNVDLEKYPRTIENDLKALKEGSCDIAFCPNDGEMFGTGSTVSIDFGNLSNVLEGKFRPGHFNGVGIVVAKFFNIVQPDIAFFGQKDLQQFAIINALVKSLNYDIQLRRVPTVRNKKGLALSSRNLRLSDVASVKALIFYNSLNFAKDELKKGVLVNSIIEEIEKRFVEEEVELEYIKIVNKDSFEEMSATDEQGKMAICIAGYLEGVRLIDNMLLT